VVGKNNPCCTAFPVDGARASRANRAPPAELGNFEEAPIILIGHSLGADAVMEMAAYLGRKGVPVALVVPFDGTKSFAASANVARVLNLTHSGTLTYMRGARRFPAALVQLGKFASFAFHQGLGGR
jgi:alpha-beta hydrolase superfamily lysophospholipase